MLVELKKKESEDEELFGWLQNQEDLFVPLEEVVDGHANNLINAYPQMLKGAKGQNHADPFVIALAQALDYRVVTFEKLTGNMNKPRIPDICKNEGVTCMGFQDFIIEQGWKF